MFSSFFHFGLYTTSRISYIAVPRFVVLIALMVTEVRLCQNMKKIIVSLIFVLIAVCAYSQKDVTQFLGIPIDGSKSAMIQKLKAKGFRANSYNKDVLEGKFNGMDVNLHIATNNDKVCRCLLYTSRCV